VRISPWVLGGSLALALTVVGLSTPTPAAAAGPKPTKTITYVATQDATVSSATPHDNFGERPRLAVRSHGPTLVTYLRFDLRTIDPARLVGAVLTLTSPTGDRCLSGVRGVDVYTVGARWDEDTITFANAPAPQSFVASVDEFGRGRVVIDVTSDFTATTVAAYALVMPADCDLLPDSQPGDVAGATRFWSSESEASQPTLQIEYCRRNHSAGVC
jgi:hypothetical protein